MKNKLIALLLILLTVPVYSWDQRYEEDDDDVNRVTVHGTRIAGWFGGFGGMAGKGFALGAIIGAGGSGELFQSADTVETDSDPKQCGEGNPILMATGNKVQYETDFIGKEEFPLSISRTYNHYWNNESVFGKNWVTNLSRKLTFVYPEFGCGDYVPHYSKPSYCESNSDSYNEASEIYAYRPDGVKLQFHYDSAKGYWVDNKADPVNKLVKGEYNTWRFETEGNFTEEYSKYGEITKVTNPSGISHTYTYSAGVLDKITHSNGRYLDLTWSNGKLVSIKDSAGNQYTYRYSGSRLTGVTIPGTPSLVKDYFYTNSSYPDALTQININNKKYATFAYHSDGRGKSTSHWAWDSTEVDKHTFTYSGSTTTVMNPLGHKKDYQYATINGVKKLTQVSRQYYDASCPYASKSISYDTKGMVETTTDWRGRITEYVYNDKGQLESKTIAKGRPDALQITYTWIAGENKVSKVELADLKTEYTYNTSGRVSSIKQTNLSSYGVANEQRTVTYSYTNHSNGMVQTVTVNGPRDDLSIDDIVTMNFDSKGNLTSQVNALGHTTSFSNYDLLGNPKTITSPNGLVTNLTYDAQGRILTKTVQHPSGNMQTSYTYNPMGQLLKVTYPDGNYYTNQYDQAYRLTKTTDKNGAYKVFNYNANGNLIDTSIHTTSTTYVMPPGCSGPIASKIEEMKLIRTFLYEACIPSPVTTYTTHKTSSYEYDAMGRLKVANGANGQKSEYTYDNNSNVFRIKDAYGNWTIYEYDSFNRVTAVNDKLRNETNYTYDDAGRIASVSDARGLTTYYYYSGFGELVEQVSPDTGSTRYEYNKAGLVTKIIRNNGEVSTFTYDSLGRIKSETHGSLTKTYGYDQYANRTGRLYYVNDPSGQTVYWYDSVGNITRKRSKVDGIYYNTYYTYDGMNQLTSMTYPSGRKTLYTYDGLGQVSEVRYAKGATIKTVASGINYRPFGPVSELTFGNGALRRTYHDQDYRLTGISTSGIQSLSYTYDKKNNITKITNGVVSGATQNYAYDAMDRLTSVTGYKANTYTYDAVGNRKSQIKNGSTETYSYSANSNQLVSVGGSSISYNSNGQTQSKLGSSYSYNDENRLSQHTKSGQSTTYSYNALGQRVKKSNSSSTTRFFYDESGRLIAEYLVAENKWKEYIYLHGQVVGFAVNGALYYVHNDHLGRAERITNASKSTVWRANNYDFDRVVAYGSADWYNLGFPGQYYDSEKDSYYNYLRDYDPKTGRYIQSDPIGLAGGINTYAYVGGNPINWFDPFGLSQCSCIEEQNRNSPDGDMWEKRRINENGQDEIYRFGRWNPVHDVNSMHGAIAQNSMDFATDFGWTTVGAWLQNIRKTSVVGTALSFNFSTLRTAARHYSSHMNSTYTSEETKIIEELNSNFAACARNAAGGIDE
ncbi:MAG TPA: RHS repeat-associated core domain-containing protein [Kangiella sp.]